MRRRSEKPELAAPERMTVRELVLHLGRDDHRRVPSLTQGNQILPECGRSTLAADQQNRPLRSPEHCTCSFDRIRTGLKPHYSARSDDKAIRYIDQKVLRKLDHNRTGRT